MQRETGTHQLLSEGYRVWLLLILLLTSTLSFADRTVFAVVSQVVKQELKFTDFELGALQGIGFALIYAIAAVPIARVAEHRSRVAIIALSVAAWSVMTAVSGMATNFLTMLLSRAGVGIGETGGNAPATSLISDHFPASRRSFANSVFLLGSPLGALVGSFLGGWVAQHLGWRMAFYVLAAPGAIIAIAVILGLREPPRGLADDKPAPTTAPPSLWEAFRYLIAKPTFSLATIAASLAAVGMSSVSQWMVPFLSRTYHLGVQTTAQFYGIITFIALSSGLLLGGLLGDRLGRADGRWQNWAPAIGVALAVPLYDGAFVQSNLWGAVALLLLGGFSLFIYFAPTVACIQNMAAPRMRASAAALFGLLFSTSGPGFGPTIMGYFSDRYAHSLFKLGDFATACKGVAHENVSSTLSSACALASAEGLRDAFITVITSAFSLSAVFFLLASLTIRRDVYQTEQIDA